VAAGARTPKTDNARLIGEQLSDGRSVQLGPFGQFLRRKDRLFYRIECILRVHGFYCLPDFKIHLWVVQWLWAPVEKPTRNSVVNWIPIPTEFGRVFSSRYNLERARFQFDAFFNLIY